MMRKKTRTIYLGLLFFLIGISLCWLPLTVSAAPSYTVTYDHLTNGGGYILGSVKLTEKVLPGTEVDLSVQGKKSNWEFVGWNTDKNATTGLASLTMPESDIKLYAIYKKTLTVTLIDYSGIQQVTRTLTETIYNKTSSASLVLPEQNTYTGWTSRGWTFSSASNVAGTMPGQTITISNSTIYYGMYKRLATVSFDANGGSSTPNRITHSAYVNSCDIAAVSKSYGFKVPPGISRTGYTFDGWALNGPEGPKYDPGTLLAVAADSKMYAVWKEATPPAPPDPPTPYTITYNPTENGGTSASAATATGNSGDAVNLTPTAEKANWDFIGWNTDKNATEGLSACTMPAGNLTLYAIYQKTLTLTLKDYNGIKATTREISEILHNKTNTATISLPVQNTLTGWTPRGWSAEKGATVTAGTPKTITLSADLTLYGQYYRILAAAYHPNGGTPAPPTQGMMQYVNSYEITAPLPAAFTLTFTLPEAISRTDHIFDGWGNTHTGARYSAGQEITITENTLFAAIWKPAQSAPHYTVTYNYTENGGRAATESSVPATSGAAVNLTPKAAKSDNWEFIGWNTDKNATEGLTSCIMPASDLTLYAIYKKTLTLTLKDYNGTEPVTREEKETIYNKAVTATITIPEQNTLTGWAPRGWSPEKSAAAAGGKGTITINRDMTLYGQYYRYLAVAYHANGGDSTPEPQNAVQYLNSYDISVPTPAELSLTLPGAITRTNLAFDGWTHYTTGVKYNAGQVVNISENTMFVATWKLILPPPVPVARVTIMVKWGEKWMTSSSLQNIVWGNVGTTYNLAAAILPLNATYPMVKWRSSNEKIATVDQNGKVTIVGRGEATIYAEAIEGVTKYEQYARIRVQGK